MACTVGPLALLLSSELAPVQDRGLTAGWRRCRAASAAAGVRAGAGAVAGRAGARAAACHPSAQHVSRISCGCEVKHSVVHLKAYGRKASTSQHITSANESKTDRVFNNTVRRPGRQQESNGMSTAE